MSSRICGAALNVFICSGKGIMPMRHSSSLGYRVFCPEFIQIPARSHKEIFLEILVEVPVGYSMRLVPARELLWKGLICPMTMLFPREDNGRVVVDVNNVSDNEVVIDRGFILGTIFMEAGIMPVELKETRDASQFFARMNFKPIDYSRRRPCNE